MQNTSKQHAEQPVLAAGGAHNLWWLLLSIVAIGLDQLSKYWIVQTIKRFDSIPVLPHLNLVHLQNTGAAFSMMNTAPSLIFVALSAVVSLGLIIWLAKHPYGHRIVACAFALILGGALGNAIDRLRLGYVTDFIDFYIRDTNFFGLYYVRDWHFAAFNIADSAITLGAGLLILDMLLESRRAQQVTA